jgi:hypothetical protein
MVQVEKLRFMLSLSVVILVYFIVLSLNHYYVDGVTENGFNTSTSQSYTNDKIGVSLEHPADWKPVDIKNGFQLVKEKDKVYVEIRRNNLESSNIQLGKYVDDDIKDRNSSREQFELLNKSQSTISGNLPAYKALYSFLKTKSQKDFSAEGKTEKILRIWTFSHGNVFTVAYVSEDDKYDLYLPTADKIIDSFKIKGVETGPTLTTAEGGVTKTSPTSENNTPTEINKKHTIQGGPNNTTFTITNKSLMTSAESGEAFPSQANATGPSEVGNQTYENSTFGIKMQYPSNWKAQGFRDSVRFVSPKEGAGDNYIQTIDLFTYPVMPPIQAVENLTNYYNTSLTNFTKIGSPHASIGANSSSVSFLYSFNDKIKGPVRSMDFVISPNGSDKTYLFTFKDEASMFQRDLSQAQKIIDSIKFLK